MQVSRHHLRPGTQTPLLHHRCGAVVTVKKSEIVFVAKAPAIPINFVARVSWNRRAYLSLQQDSRKAGTWDSNTLALLAPLIADARSRTTWLCGLGKSMLVFL